MTRYVGDLHIHIGRTSDGQPIKITGARDLTFANIAHECLTRKGVALAGVVDCASPPVIRDIEQLVAAGEMVEQPGGGLRYRDSVTVLLGSELETVETDGGASHHVSYFPTLESLKAFSERVKYLVTNLDLSSQRCRIPARFLLRITREVNGLFVPAHAFTPHKSVYGSCAPRLGELFPNEMQHLAALELGLSADADMADRLAELAEITFLSNSDAHSLPKIAREHNLLEMEGVDFVEFQKALARRDGRRVVDNFGLDPRLGKYHRTFCPKCEMVQPGEPPVSRCGLCGTDQVVKGVLDRVVEIADWLEPRPPAHRPPYRYQVPLQFIPGVGAVVLDKLLNRFGTEMVILHEVPGEELVTVAGRKVAGAILAAREGRLALLAGGGGHYGRAVTDAGDTQLSMGI